MLNMLMLWNKLICMNENRILRRIFEWEDNLGVNKWCAEVEYIFDEINCHHIFRCLLQCDVNQYKAKLLNSSVVQWSNSKLDKPKLR